MTTNKFKTILAAALLGMAAFTAADIAPANAQNTVQFGILGTFSGAGTSWGIATQRGAKIAADEINATGGIDIAGQKYKITFAQYDDAYTGQGGVVGATHLIDVDGVKFIVGPIGSPAVLGALGVTSSRNVIMMDDGFAKNILTPQNTYNFRISLSTYEFGPAIVAWLKTTFPKAHKVGIISPSDTFNSVTKELARDYTAGGFDVASNDKYDRGTTDFSALITRMMSQSPDIFEIAGSAPGDAGLLVKQAREMGYKGVILQSGGPAVDQIIKVAGAFADNMYTYDIFDPNAPAAQAFVKAYAAQWPGPINAYAPIMYNATQLLAEAIHRAGSMDTDKVKAAMEQLTGFNTIFGPVRWGGMQNYGINHQLLINFYITQVQNGKLHVVASLHP